MVRLTEPEANTGTKSYPNFNSIMVRLTDLSYYAQNTVQKFQFHHGAINGRHALRQTVSSFQFQFHHGAINGQVSVL